MDDLQAFYEAHNVVDRYVRQSTLEEDLAAILSESGLTRVTEADLREKPTNASQRDKDVIYHDAETVALVAREERFLIDLFGFEPPTAKARAA